MDVRVAAVVEDTAGAAEVTVDITSAADVTSTGEAGRAAAVVVEEDAITTTDTMITMAMAETTPIATTVIPPTPTPQPHRGKDTWITEKDAVDAITDAGAVDAITDVEDAATIIMMRKERKDNSTKVRSDARISERTVRNSKRNADAEEPEVTEGKVDIWNAEEADGTEGKVDAWNTDNKDTTDTTDTTRKDRKDSSTKLRFQETVKAFPDAADTEDSSKDVETSTRHRPEVTSVMDTDRDSRENVMDTSSMDRDSREDVATTVTHGLEVTSMADTRNMDRDSRKKTESFSRLMDTVPEAKEAVKTFPDVDRNTRENRDSTATVKDISVMVDTEGTETSKLNK